MGSVWKGVDWEEREGLESRVAKGSQVHPPSPPPASLFKIFYWGEAERGGVQIASPPGVGGKSPLTGVYFDGKEKP